jgi:hypothetical protein
MNIRRYKALILAVLPFLLAGFLLYSVETANGFSGIGYLVVLIVSFPFLAGASVLSVIFAFNSKDPKRKLIRTTKFLSVISLIVFVGICTIGAIGSITSMM